MARLGRVRQDRADAGDESRHRHCHHKHRDRILFVEHRALASAVCRCGAIPPAYSPQPALGGRRDDERGPKPQPDGGEGSVGQLVGGGNAGAHRMHQPVGSSVQDEPHLVGQRRAATCAATCAV